MPHEYRKPGKNYFLQKFELFNVKLYPLFFYNNNTLRKLSFQVGFVRKCFSFILPFIFLAASQTFELTSGPGLGENVGALILPHFLETRQKSSERERSGAFNS